MERILESGKKGIIAIGIGKIMQKEKIKPAWFAIAALYLAILTIFLSSYAFDDLGFDFAGYALRYEFAFKGWIKEILLGIPAGTFDATLPALLPLFFKAIGFGSFTLPVTLSILALQLTVPVVFIFIGKRFGLEKEKAMLLGLLFVLNPITFKFLNRYYEFASWAFFLLAFFFFYGFLQEKKFDKKLFALTVISSVAIVLSHPSGLYFWAIGFVFLLHDFVDFKRFAAVAFFTLAICAFWLLPFFSFSQLSIVASQKGAELSTTGILAASWFFAIAFPAIILLFGKKLKQNARTYNLTLFSAMLAIVYAVAPGLPVLNVPFAHSFHVFFSFVLAIVAMQLLKAKVIEKQHFVFVGILCIACVLFFFPIVARQFLFTEPRYSDYEFEGQRINFADIEKLAEQIPKNSRFETLPYDAVASAFIVHNFGLLELRGWGYNAYALKESDAIGKKLTGFDASCEEFIAGAEKTATRYWIALAQSGYDSLKQCGLKKVAGDLPALFVLESEKAGLVDGAEILAFEDKSIILKATKKTILVKQSFFPRWHAIANGNELKIEDAEPGMLLRSQPGTIIELNYGSVQEDFFGTIISVGAVLLFLVSLV